MRRVRFRSRVLPAACELFGAGLATARALVITALAITGLVITAMPDGRAVAAEHDPAPRRPIDLGDLDAVRAVKPLLIAHRGGVVTVKSPECSRAAIRLAAQAGYHMVELDVRPTKDDEPAIFHDRDLSKATGRTGSVRDFDLAEITTIRYRAIDETIASLDEALATCRELGLGVMLDVKQADSPLMLKRTVELVRKHRLEHSTITLNSDPRIAGPLAEVSLVHVKSRAAVAKPGRPGQPLAGYFWCGIPKDLPWEDVPRLQREGALILPGINTFRYPDAEHETLAAADIRRLKELGVDGFQIDSVYQQHFGMPKVP
jgi:glycerophosphoryl diester phosphodiesterase